MDEHTRRDNIRRAVAQLEQLDRIGGPDMPVTQRAFGESVRMLHAAQSLDDRTVERLRSLAEKTASKELSTALQMFV